MAEIVYTKTIVGMMAYPSEPRPNCVYQVNWNLTGSDGAYETTANLATQIPFEQDGSYIPYDQLTEADVMGWIDQYTPPEAVDEAKARIAGWISGQYAPNVPVAPPLPWAPPQAAEDIAPSSEPPSQ